MTTPPITYNMTIYQGANFDRTFERGAFVDGVFTPTDLTGYSARMQARPTAESPVKFLDIDTGSKGSITIDGVNGRVTIALTAAQTAALPSAGGHYDLELVDGDGNVARLAMGTLTVSKEVTR